MNGPRRVPTPTAAFLDRDGTLMADPGYPDDPSRVTLLQGVVEALRALESRGVPAVVVTNQSGIGRGLFTEEDFRSVQRELERQLAMSGCVLAAVYHCPHPPEAGCDCRKPALGLYRRAARELALDLSGALYVGDRLCDVLPALETGGIGRLLCGGGDAPEGMPPGIGVARDLLGAVREVLGETEGGSS